MRHQGDGGGDHILGWPLWGQILHILAILGECCEEGDCGVVGRVVCGAARGGLRCGGIGLGEVHVLVDMGIASFLIIRLDVWEHCKNQRLMLDVVGEVGLKKKRKKIESTKRRNVVLVAFCV